MVGIGGRSLGCEIGDAIQIDALLGTNDTVIDENVNCHSLLSRVISMSNFARQILLWFTGFWLE